MSTSQQNDAMSYVISLLAIILTIISGWQSFRGYEPMLYGFMAASLALGLSLAMLASNMRLKELRQKGENISAVMIFLSILIFFSFISNFNAIYTRIVGEDTNIMAVDDAKIIFGLNMEKADKALKKQEKYQEYLEFNKSLNGIKDNIWKQIANPGLPGVGKRAKVHLKEAEKLLHTNFTEQNYPKGSSHPPEWWENYADKIIARIEDDEKAEKVKRFGGLGKILTDIEDYQQQAKEMNKKEDIEKLRSWSNDIEGRLGLILDENEMPEIDTTINSKMYATGKIPDTFKTAFLEKFSNNTIMAVLLSLLLDLLIPLIVIVSYKSNGGHHTGGFHSDKQVQSNTAMDDNERTAHDILGDK